MDFQPISPDFFRGKRKIIQLIIAHKKGIELFLANIQVVRLKTMKLLNMEVNYVFKETLQ